jgi:hypothetical protein
LELIIKFLISAVAFGGIDKNARESWSMKVLKMLPLSVLQRSSTCSGPIEGHLVDFKVFEREAHD